MDDRTKTLIVTTLVLLIIVGLIAGVIFYISRLIRTRQVNTASQNVPKGTISVSSPSPKSTQQATSSSQSQPANTKVYQGEGFQLYYPQNWGLLTCSNSRNFELDPTSSSDQLNIVCDVARKPVTIIVGSQNCPQGESMDKGGVGFTKVKTEVTDGLNYKWCIKRQPLLEISHRVSQTGGRATSKQDFSSQIEEIIIANFRSGRSS